MNQIHFKIISLQIEQLQTTPLSNQFTDGNDVRVLVLWFDVFKEQEKSWHVVLFFFCNPAHRASTLPILALLLISFRRLANQLYTFRDVTRSRSESFFPKREDVVEVQRWVSCHGPAFIKGWLRCKASPHLVFVSQHCRRWRFPPAWPRQDTGCR